MEASSNIPENPQKENLVSDALGSIAAFSQDVSIVPELNGEREVSEDKSEQMENSESYVDPVMEDEDVKVISKDAGVNSLSDMEYSSDENKTHSDNSSLEKIEMDAKPGEEVIPECIEDDDIEVIEKADREEDVEVYPARNVYEPEISTDSKEVEHESPDKKVKDILAKAMEEISDKRIKEILEKTIEEMPDVENSDILSETLPEVVTPQKPTAEMEKETCQETLMENNNETTDDKQQEINIPIQDITEKLPMKTTDQLSQKKPEQTPKQPMDFTPIETMSEVPELKNETAQENIEKLSVGTNDIIQNEKTNITPNEIIEEIQHDTIDETEETSEEENGSTLIETTSELSKELIEEMPTPQNIENEILQKLTVETDKETNTQLEQDTFDEMAKAVSDVIPIETMKEEITNLSDREFLDINKVGSKGIDEIPQSPIVQIFDDVIKEIPQNLIKEIPDKIFNVLAKKEETKQSPETANEDMFGMDVDKVTNEQLDTNIKDVIEESNVENKLIEPNGNSTNVKEMLEKESKNSTENQSEVHEAPMLTISENQDKDSEIQTAEVEKATKPEKSLDLDECLEVTSVQEINNVSESIVEEGVENPIETKLTSGKETVETFEETSKDTEENQLKDLKEAVVIDDECLDEGSHIDETSIIEKTNEGVLLEAEEIVAEKNKDDEQQENKTEANEILENIVVESLDDTTVQEAPLALVSEFQDAESDLSKNNLIGEIQEPISSDTQEIAVENNQQTDECLKVTLEHKEDDILENINNEYTVDDIKLLTKNIEETPKVFGDPKEVNEDINKIILAKLEDQSETNEEEVNELKDSEKDTFENVNTSKEEITASEECKHIIPETPKLYQEIESVPKRLSLNFETNGEEITGVCEKVKPKQENVDTNSAIHTIVDKPESDGNKSEEEVGESDADILDPLNEIVENIQNSTDDIQEVKEEEIEEKCHNSMKKEEKIEESTIELCIPAQIEINGNEEEILVTEESKEIVGMSLYTSKEDQDIATASKIENDNQLVEEVKDEVTTKETELSPIPSSEIEPIQEGDNNEIQIIDNEEMKADGGIDFAIIQNKVEEKDENVSTSLSDMEYSSDENNREGEDNSSEKQDDLTKEVEIQDYEGNEEKDTKIKESFEIISEAPEENNITSLSNLEVVEELEGSNKNKERTESKSDTSEDYDTCNEEAAKLTSTSTCGGYETCNEDIKEEDELTKESDKLERKLMIDNSIVEDYDTCDEEVTDVKVNEVESSEEKVSEKSVVENIIAAVTSEIMNHPKDIKEEPSPIQTPESEESKKDLEEINITTVQEMAKNAIKETMDEILHEMEEKKNEEEKDSTESMEVFSKKGEEELEMKVKNHDIKPFVPHQSNPQKKSVLVRILQILLGCFNCFQGQAS